MRNLGTEFKRGASNFQGNRGEPVFDCTGAQGWVFLGASRTHECRSVGGRAF